MEQILGEIYIFSLRTTGGSHNDQHVDCDSDQCETTTRNPGSWLPSSDLTPLNEVEEI
jgi:hypothetical protein